MSSSGPFSSKAFRIPIWIQLSIGLAVVGLIYYAAVSSNPYVSAWDEENSNFYEDAMQALRHFSLNPTAPTAIIFWDKENEDCPKSIRALNSSPSNLRIYGVHLSNTNDMMGIRKAWLKYAPRRASLIMDRSQMLETSFHVRTLPMVYIILPKQKKIFSYLGNINDSRERFLEIVQSE